MANHTKTNAPHHQHQPLLNDRLAPPPSIASTARVQSTHTPGRTNNSHPTLQLFSCFQTKTEHPASQWERKLFVAAALAINRPTALMSRTRERPEIVGVRWWDHLAAASKDGILGALGLHELLPWLRSCCCRSKMLGATSRVNHCVRV